MAGVKTPTAFTAGRRFGLEGVTYQPGDAVPLAVVGRVKRLGALISRGFLVPNVERRGRLRVGRRMFSDATYSAKEIQGFK